MERRDDSDEDLMRCVALGKRDALNALMRRYASPLLTFIVRMVGHRQRAEDLFQEVFLAVWIGCRSYRYPRPFRCWLFGIAVKKCRADLRRHWRWPRRLEDCPAACPEAADPLPAEVVAAAETAALVAGAVTRLPEMQRAVVAMRVWNGLSYAEIAEAVGCGEATIRSHMFHGLKTMRRYLEPRMK